MPPRTSHSAGNQRDRQNGQRAEPVVADPPVVGQVVSDPEREAQAAFEGVADAPTIEFAGERFRLAERVSYLPLLKFAHYASKGTDSASMQGMAAMYEMLRACFDRGRPCGECEICLGDEEIGTAPNPHECQSRIGDQWPRFEDLAIEIGADDEDLFGVVTTVIEVSTARPTRRRSGSSQPAPQTSQNSKGRSPAQAAGLVPVDDLAH